MRTKFPPTELLGPLLLLSILFLLITACTPTPKPAPVQIADTSQITPAEATSTSNNPTTHAPIVLPITAYILDDMEGERSSQRSAEQLRDIYEQVNAIWAPAGIIIDLQSVYRVQLPEIYLTAISSSDFDRFFRGVNQDFSLPEPSLLNAFYASDIGGPNGITPLRTRTFFVTDFPSVHHERVSSHEIGHILGLHHVPNDSGRLMYSGTNGMALSEEEVAVARYAARGLLDGLR